MPLPLIAVALIVAGSASGGTGVALGGKGAYDMKRARDAMAKAERRYQRKRKETDAVVAETNERLARLGSQQQDALERVVLRMGDFLRRHEKQVRDGERLLIDGIDVTVGRVSGGARLDPDAVAWVRGALGAAVAGGGVSSGVTAAVGTYGVASTGAAISGLSGAAAQSATLAALGGGSLASGGGGVALGATALNFVTIGPTLLVGGMVVKGQGTKALTKAQEYESTVNVAIAGLKDTRTRLGGVQARVGELSDLLERLVEAGEQALDLLESETFIPEKHVDRFQRAIALTMAVRDVAATPVIDGEGGLNDKTEDFEVRYRPMTEEEDD